MASPITPNSLLEPELPEPIARLLTLPTQTLARATRPACLTNERSPVEWGQADWAPFAADRAGVTLSGQGDTYFKHIGLFSSSDVFNQDQRLTLREQATIYAGNSTWAWISESDLKQYRSIRKSSQRARVRSYYLTGFAIAVRLASAIDVQRSLPASDYLPSLNLHTPPDGSVWMMAKLTF